MNAVQIRTSEQKQSYVGGMTCAYLFSWDKGIAY